MEKILYDTSKLIDIYKKDKKAQGYTTIFNLIEFPKALELDLNVLYPTKYDYNTALRLSTVKNRKTDTCSGRRYISNCYEHESCDKR